MKRENAGKWLVAVVCGQGLGQRISDQRCQRVLQIQKNEQMKCLAQFFLKKSLLEIMSYYTLPHLTGKETEAQRRYGIYPKSHSRKLRPVSKVQYFHALYSHKSLSPTI
jgi:predicted nucleic acid-binding Zn ribbon protein